MAVQEIPKAYEYTCDKCGAKHRQENASGHYANSTPPDWMSLRISEYSKAPVDALLCGACKKLAVPSWVQNLNVHCEAVS